MVLGYARLRTCVAVLGLATVVAMPQVALSDPAHFIALQGPDSHTVYTAAAAGKIRVHVCVADLQGATQVEVRVLNPAGDHSYDVMALGPHCAAWSATLEKGQAIAIWLRRGDCGEIPAEPGDSAKAIYDIRPLRRHGA